MPAPEVTLLYTKWDGSPHWHVPALRLGTDRHGTWLGTEAGTRISRPGVELHLVTDAVMCVPEDQPWVATLYAVATPGDVEVYVDLTTPARWTGAQVTAVDLDLDVVLPHGGVAFVDDEDEFAEHRVHHGYPADLVRTTEAACARLLDEVAARRPPSDPATADRWLRVLRTLAGGSSAPS